MMTINRDKVRDIFRDHLLDALDEATRKTFTIDNPRRTPGATDADLPRLFKALDEQIETLAARYDFALVDHEQTSVPL